MIYFDVIDAIDRVFGIHGMAHITGGGFTKIKRFLGNHDAYINRFHDLEPQLIFWDLLGKGVPEKDMYRIFNCNIGFVIGVSNDKVNACLSVLRQQFKVAVIGYVTSGTGKVHIQSKFSNEAYIY